MTQTIPAFIGAALSLIVLATLVIWPVQRAGLAIERMLPDPSLDKLTQTPIVKYAGFDPRPMLRYRREQLNRRISQDREQIAHIDQRLAELEPAGVTPFESWRRA